jgi:hypothetical protein
MIILNCANILSLIFYEVAAKVLEIKRAPIRFIFPEALVG